MNPLKRKVLSAVFFSLFLFTFIGFMYCSSSNKAEDKWFYLNESASLDLGIYIKVPDVILCLQGRDFMEYRKGDYVVFEPNTEALEFAKERKYIEGTSLFLKKIGALYGDTYAVQAINKKHYLFFINHKLYGEVLKTDKNGKPMPIKEGRFEVPQDYFLPIGDSERSFDGRYTGVVKLSNIKSIVTPLYTGLHW